CVKTLCKRTRAMKFCKFRWFSGLMTRNWQVAPIRRCKLLLMRRPKGSEVAGVTWTETFNCDICGKQKGSVDHWWLAWTELYSPHPEAPERHLLKIYPWENMMAHDATVKHLCGQAC